MNKRRYIRAMILAAILPAAVTAGADNRELMQQAAAELQRINREVVGMIKDPARYNNREILVRVRVIPRADGGQELKVEKVFVGGSETGIAEEGKVIYLKGRLEKPSSDQDYKLDLSHVLPPDDDRKTAGGTGKPSTENRK